MSSTDDRIQPIDGSRENGERVLYREGPIFISGSRITFGYGTYAVRQLAGVYVSGSANPNGTALGIMAGVFLLIGLVGNFIRANVAPHDQLGLIAVGAFFVVAAGFFGAFLRCKPLCNLVLSVNGQNERVYQTPDRTKVDRLAACISEAIALNTQQK